MAQPDIATELLHTGRSLWTSVDCDVRRDCVVVYARLRANPPLGIQSSLDESERIFKSILESRLDGRLWLASVQWSERLCRTFTAELKDERTGTAAALLSARPAGP